MSRSSVPIWRNPGGCLLSAALAHYEIRAAIGAGGMGEVYRAIDIKLGRDVAVKCLPAALAGRPGALLAHEFRAPRSQWGSPANGGGIRGCP
jgi:serine/threonine protein kinase